MRTRSTRLCLLTVPLLTLTLAACGSSGSSDKDQLTKIINNAQTDPKTVCDNLDAKLLKQIGGKDACEKLAKQQPKGKKPSIKDIKVNGDTATATVKEKSGTTTLKFTKQGGDWKLSSTG